MKRLIAVCACVFALVMALMGCSSGAASGSSAAASSAAASTASQSTATAPEIAPGVYSAKFVTDSSMFHVNETMDDRGQLTVTDEGMTIHVTLVSKKIVNLYVGLADDAQADEANVIQPTLDKVTYDDGYEKEVYGFDVPVPALDQEFDVAILGEKGKWYDHKVTVSDPVSE